MPDLQKKQQHGFLEAILLQTSKANEPFLSTTYEIIKIDTCGLVRLVKDSIQIDINVSVEKCIKYGIGYLVCSLYGL